MRNKSNLITKTPLRWLTRDEYNRIVTDNPDYINVLFQKRNTEESFHDIRKELRVYVVVITTGTQFRVLAGSKKGALSKLAHDNEIKPSQVAQIQVEYETYTRELKLPARVSKTQEKSK